MTRASFAALVVVLASGCRSPAQSEPVATTDPSPAPPAAAPDPTTLPFDERPVTAIDVFGTTRPAAEIVDALGLRPGMTLGSIDAGVEERAARLKRDAGFLWVDVSPISYGDGRTFVTVDIVEAGDDARMVFDAAPTGHPPDPDGLVAAWIAYETTMWRHVEDGSVKLGGPSSCKGGFHCALGFGHADVQDAEALFIEKTPKHFAAVRRVLEEEADEHARAAAAFVLAYGKTRREVVDALVPAMDDPSPLVRNNAVRVLLMTQDGADEPLVPLDPLLRALQYPETTDRNKAGYGLLALLKKYEGRPDRTVVLRRVRAEAGKTLEAMAALQQPNNRDPAREILALLPE